MDKSNINSCVRTGDIVAYMYDELETGERSRFEKHLADCMSCIDEFAAVSDARFAVYEWHKEEFTPLPTPEFSIPYTADPQPSIGFFAAVGDMIRGAGWPVAAAASLVLIVGLVLAATIFTDTGGQIAQVEVKNGSQPAEARIAELPEMPEPVVEKSEVRGSSMSPAVFKARSSQPRADRYTKRNSRKTVKPPARTEPSPVMSKAPVLSSYEENEDRSLRLSDLLDEIGG